uniref:MTS domain-containing protein n=1 Tax=Macrostomum lignano TaxID=282301 RepID=A0A1I8FJX4_9PLAT
ALEAAGSFLVNTCGQIESAEIPHYDYIFIISCTRDWERVLGLEEAVSQLSSKSDDVRGLHNFAMPVDVTWKATNPARLAPAGDHGAWHRRVGHAGGQGYAVCHLPMQAGPLRQTDPACLRQVFVCSAQSRASCRATAALTRTRRYSAKARPPGDPGAQSGSRQLTFNTCLKNLRTLGYQTTSAEVGAAVTSSGIV